MASKAEIERARAALKRLELEVDRPGGYSEFAHFSEELLVEILPYLNSKGLEIVRSSALSNCQLEETK